MKRLTKSELAKIDATREAAFVVEAVVEALVNKNGGVDEEGLDALYEHAEDVAMALLVERG